MLLVEKDPGLPAQVGLLARVGPRALTLAQDGVGRLWPLPFRPAADPAPPGLEVRLARTAKEVRRAQRLRYRVFFEEGSAVPGPGARVVRRDADAFDPLCDHLLVLDHDVRPKPFRKRKPRVVGTYRLLRRDVAEANGGFYSAREFDIGPLLAGRPDTNILELGRSCVLAAYRGRRTVELLWQGIWAYCLRNDVEAMIGCASFAGTDPEILAHELSYLHHHAASPAAWRVRARPERHVEMGRLPAEVIDRRAVLRSMPPLIKGYLRVGASFGEGAVVDHRFGTTDVFVVLPIEAIQARYLDHFDPADRTPA